MAPERKPKPRPKAPKPDAPQAPAPSSAPVEAQPAADTPDASHQIRAGLISDLLPDEQNANRGTAPGRTALDASMRRYGAGRSVLADKHGRLIAGNKATQAAIDAGLTNTIVVPVTGDQLVVVQRLDLDLEADSKAKELAIADNRVQELDLEWDPEVLRALQKDGIALEEFFAPSELEKLLNPDGEDEDGEERGAELPEMELQPYEEYNYVVLLFRNSQDWQSACEKLQLERQQFRYQDKVQRVGLGRVVDGAKAMKRLCPSAPSSTPDSE